MISAWLKSLRDMSCRQERYLVMKYQRQYHAPMYFAKTEKTVLFQMTNGVITMKKTYKLVDKIERKGFPTSSPMYKKAHAAANKAEKKKYPSGFKAMKKVDSKLPKHQLAGTNKKSGKIEVSKKVPKKYRDEVALHEKTERAAFKKLRKKK